MVRRPWTSPRCVPSVSEQVPERSEQQFQSKLNVPRVLRRQDVPEGRRPNENVGQAEVGPVEQIERLGPELQRDSLAKGRVLHQGKINGLERRSVENIASGVAETAVGRNYERRGVEPKVRGLVGTVRVARDVRPVVGAE